jgi:uncharacterized protein (DUF1330 family)
MPAFLVATVTITDPEKFSGYSKAIAGLSEKFGGEYIVRGPITEVLEGDIAPDQRVVVSKFPSAQAARDYIGSPEYQAGAVLRQGAGTVEMRLIEVA